MQHQKLPGELVRVTTQLGPIVGELVEIRADQEVTLQVANGRIRIAGRLARKIKLEGK
jgi:hypothetical protein